MHTQGVVSGCESCDSRQAGSTGRLLEAKAVQAVIEISWSAQSAPSPGGGLQGREGTGREGGKQSPPTSRPPVTAAASAMMWRGCGGHAAMHHGTEEVAAHPSLLAVATLTRDCSANQPRPGTTLQPCVLAAELQSPESKFNPTHPAVPLNITPLQGRSTLQRHPATSSPRQRDAM